MFDWLPTVVTTLDGDYPYIDESLKTQVSSQLKVIRTKTPTFGYWFKFFFVNKENIPYGSLQTTKNDSFLKKMAFFTRKQLVSPDSRVIWNKHAYKAAEKLLISGKYDAIITTGPPQSTHLIGEKLKKKFKIPWIADFRDPWTKIYYLESEKRNPVIKRIDANFEKNVFEKADKVITVSKGFKEGWQNYLDKISVIHNAFDPDDFFGVNYKRTDKFRIKFIGALTSSRKSDVLKTIHWIEEFAKKNDYHNLEFSLIGDTFDDSFKSLKNSNISIIDNKFIEHKDVINECVNSESLLFVINRVQNNSGILAYKLYEYIGSKTFIFSIGPNDGNVKEIIRDDKLGICLEYEDKKAFMEKLGELYNKWNNNESIKNNNEMHEYSVPNSCSVYANILNDLTQKQ
jgi:glycosyltransferase involved in cell wall biosynthesis